MLLLRSSLQSNNNGCEEKAATGYLVSTQTPNRSVDEDLRCSARWGNKEDLIGVRPCGEFLAFTGAELPELSTLLPVVVGLRGEGPSAPLADTEGPPPAQRHSSVAHDANRCST